MKSYRNAIAALVLAFVLSTSAFAGDGIIWAERIPPPPPPATGVIYTDIAAPAPEGEALTEIALILLQSVLSLI